MSYPRDRKNVDWKEPVGGAFPWSARSLSENRLLENIIRFELNSRPPSSYILIKKRTSWIVFDLDAPHFKCVLIIVLIT